MKYIVEKSLEYVVMEITDKFIEYNNKYQYRHLKKEWRKDIINFLVDDYSSIYSENELLEFNLEERLWEDLRYGFSFAKGLEECTALLQDKYPSEAYEFCKDIAEQRLEEIGAEINSSLIDAEIEKMISEGALLSDYFIEHLEGGDDFITLLNADGEDADDNVFLAIREPY